MPTHTVDLRRTPRSPAWVATATHRRLGLLLTLSVGACTGVIDDVADPFLMPGPEEIQQGPALRDPIEPLCGTTLDVGRSPLRRLTRGEYSNTVRDLLGLEGDGARRAAAALASDEKLGVFDANTFTPVTNLRIEQYVAVAEELATSAVARLDRLIAPCEPALEGEDECAADFIERFGMRAYRRPLSADEQASYMSAYELGKSAEDFRFGIQIVVEAFLQSPNFLYHLELGDEADVGDLRAADPWEVASRLSYFLWSSMPDDELLAAAESGALVEVDALHAQALRMLDDPRAEATIISFHEQWLHIEDMDTMEKDPVLFPSFDDALRDAMRAETTRFADQVIRHGDGRLATLLTAPYSFLEGPLFELYGVTEPVDHNPLDPVDLPPERAGILTHASVLARQSHPEQTSPVHRGKLVRESVLCQPIPPAPPGVSTDVPMPSPDATTRQRFAAHSNQPACAGCHSLMDPLGLGFEAYDAIGAFRTTEAGRAIDATGVIHAAGDVNGPFDGAVELAERLSESDDVRECVARQWFRYAIRRLEGPTDTCSLAHIFQGFVDSDFDIRTLILAIVTSDAFRYRRLSPTTEEME